MRYTSVFALAFLITSCIPLRIAPEISDHKITVGKKFRRTLPKTHVFIFEDPKDADEFYNYINIKFELNHIDVEYNVPIKINDVGYYLSFYEAEIPDKTLNLLPIAIDAATSNSYSPTDLSEAYTSREGNWYIAISVTDEDLSNTLDPLYPFRNDIIEYLKNLKQEYLTTHDYDELAFKKKP